MNTRLGGRILVALQLGLAAAFLTTGPWRAQAHGLLALEGAGIALAVWAAWLMRAALRATPAPAAHAQLLTRGPYRAIRHPMYAGLMLASLALLIEQPTPARTGLWLTLLLVLLVKLRLEERLLAARFPAYRAYQAATKRLIPFLY